MNTSAKRENKCLFIIICAAFLILALALVYFEINKYSDYKNEWDTSYSTGSYGMKGLYRSLEIYGEEQGFSVARNMKYVRFAPENALTICVSPAISYLEYGTEAEDIRARLEAGEVFVITEAGTDMSEYYAAALGLTEAEQWTTEFESLKLLTYGCGKGALYVLPWEHFLGLTNAGLKADSSEGAEFLEFISFIMREKQLDTVVFGEFYLGITEDSSADILGLGLILGVTEMGIGAVIFLLSKAKRFGAPVHDTALEHRGELEHVEALAKLYKRTGSWKIAFDINMEVFLREVGASWGISGGPAEIAEELSADKRAVKCGAANLAKIYMSEKKNISEKEAIGLVKKIEQAGKEML